MGAVFLSVFLATGAGICATNSTSLGTDYIVEHNIFSPDRHYVPEKSKGPGSTVTGAVKLKGISIVGDLREAVISIKGANPPVVVLKEGEEANGCKVLKVSNNEVVIERNGKRETLVFEEKTNGPATAPSAKDHPPTQKEEPSKAEIDKAIEEQKAKNPFFQILEAVRKNAKTRGEKGPPPAFPFH